MDAIRNEIPAIIGPTACGKTELVLLLSKRFPIEVLSCDSRKVFRGADIGAAKPTLEEQRLARFHLMDLVEPAESYSVQQYVQAALAAISDVRLRGHLPLIEGGTGLYLEALARGYDFRRAPPLPGLRKLALKAWDESSGGLTAAMQGLFSQECKSVDMQNRPRVIRLLERMLVAELKEADAISALRALGFSDATSEVLHARARGKAANSSAPVPVYGFCLQTDRAELVRRIELRTRQIIADGLVGETETLLKRGVPPEAQALTGIGYREAVMCLRGEISLDELAPLISLRTRQFAKRQDTWNRNRFCGFEQVPFTSAQERDEAFERVAEWIEKRLA